MLLQFSVKNYKSFKEKTVLSLEASSDKEHLDNLTIQGKDRILKSVAIFGANASGKSNIFGALSAAILVVRNSNVRQLGEPLSLIVPFAFDKNAVDTPSEFEFVFVADNKKYVYGFSATRLKVITEYLYVYNSNKPTTVFERDEDGLEDEQGIRGEEKYRFTVPSIRTKLKPLVERNTENKLFIATATSWNCEETKIPMMWFMKSINTYSPKEYMDLLMPVTGPMFENDADMSLRRFVNGILREADINISDYFFESKDKSYKITTVHRVVNDSGVEEYLLDMQSESLGTKNIFFLSPIIKRAFETGETVCVDEFDTSLHPMLVVYLVGLFHNPEVNKNNAQLIISSHTVALLDLKSMRRDQIYFVEKEQETGVSELYSLDEYSPRLREDIQKAYLLGRYGAVPMINEGGELCR
ncbi:MAG: ATP-binding protein [Lachnospiraceae bacterium]|nr:ATP-binding protein [Lachnospiraceae bacterium]